MTEMVVLNCGLTERCFGKSDALQTTSIDVGEHYGGYTIDYKLYPESTLLMTQVTGNALKMKPRLLFRMLNAYKLYTRKEIASEAMQVNKNRNAPLDASHQSVFLIQGNITSTQSIRIKVPSPSALHHEPSPRTRAAALATS